MAAFAVLKNRIIAISQQRFDQSLRNLARLRSLTLLTLRQLNSRTEIFKKSRWRRPPFWTRKSPYLGEEHDGYVRFQPEVEVKQFRPCALKNDSLGHNGLSYRADTAFHRTYFLFCVIASFALLVHVCFCSIRFSFFSTVPRAILPLLSSPRTSSHFGRYSFPSCWE